MAYVLQRASADRWTQRASELIGRSSVVPASTIMDRRFGTDLYVMDTPVGAVAMRSRTSSAMRFDTCEFTIRTRTRYGGETELDKIMAGAVNRMFYGVRNREGTDYAWWMFFNLNVLRDAMNKWRTEQANGRRSWPFWERHANGDGTEFYAFNARSKALMHPLFMIDCSDTCNYPGRVAYRDVLPASMRPVAAVAQPAAANDNLPLFAAPEQAGAAAGSVA